MGIFTLRGVVCPAATLLNSKCLYKLAFLPHKPFGHLSCGRNRKTWLSRVLELFGLCWTLSNVRALYCQLLGFCLNLPYLCRNREACQRNHLVISQLLVSPATTRRIGKRFTSQQDSTEQRVEDASLGLKPCVWASK